MFKKKTDEFDELKEEVASLRHSLRLLDQLIPPIEAGVDEVRGKLAEINRKNRGYSLEEMMIRIADLEEEVSRLRKKVEPDQIQQTSIFDFFAVFAFIKRFF